MVRSLTEKFCATNAVDVGSNPAGPTNGEQTDDGLLCTPAKGVSGESWNKGSSPLLSAKNGGGPNGRGTCLEMKHDFVWQKQNHANSVHPKIINVLHQNKQAAMSGLRVRFSSPPQTGV